LVEQTPDEVAAALEKSPVAGELRVLLETMAANERLLGSVFTGLAPRLRALKMDPIRRVSSCNEIEFHRMASSPVALFLGLDFEDREVLAPLNACFFLHFFLTMRKEAKKHHGRLPTPVQCYLDEFGNLGKIPHFDSHITLIRSSRIGVLLVLQSLQQLDKVYGRSDAVTIKQSCSTKMALGRLTGEDASYFVNLVGKTTVVSRSKSVSRQTTTVFAGSGNRSEQESVRDLITGDELRTLSGQVLVVSGTLDPVLVDQKPYYEDPKLRRLVPDPKKHDALERFRRCKLGLPELTASDPGADRDGSDLTRTTTPKQSGGNGGEHIEAGTAYHQPPEPSQPKLPKPSLLSGDQPLSPPPVPEGTWGSDKPPSLPQAASKSVPKAKLERDDERMLCWLAEGLSEAKIAMRLGVGNGDVREQVSGLCELFGVPNSEALAEYARARGLDKLPAERE
ncbi:MAG: type IV secretory system conjugative DNA transfer family protein, partial [Chloroflexota bacterium]|nr:type IV secretory system conjugative DNA transfer family protein [Chloroflexota bacterium]